jgi:putative transposase
VLIKETNVMPKGIKNTPEQIIAVLKQADAGSSTQDICRQQNISTATFYKWKSKYGGMEVSDARRLKGLEDENRKLKTLVADLTLDNQALRALSSKNFLSPR